MAASADQSVRIVPLFALLPVPLPPSLSSCPVLLYQLHAGCAALLAVMVHVISFVTMRADSAYPAD
jgi:hypothetical protein